MQKYLLQKIVYCLPFNIIHINIFLLLFTLSYLMSYYLNTFNNILTNSAYSQL